MSTELKSCPFCGGVGDLESQPSYSQAANTYNRYRGWCDRCGFGLDWHSDEADAITAWNTRATATPGALDPATVERCARVAEGIADADQSPYHALACVEVANRIRNLATDPHQHGRKA